MKNVHPIMQETLAPFISTEESNKYNSPYPSEVTYRSDKNFIVRLKAMIEREMKKSGYKISGENFTSLIDFIGENAEEILFDTRRTKP